MKTGFNYLTMVVAAAALWAGASESTLARAHHAAAPGSGPLGGRVLNGAKGLGGARVMIKATETGTRGMERSHRTNRRGHFQFRHMPAGRFAVTAMKAGFYPKTIFTGTQRRKDLVIHLGKPAGVVGSSIEGEGRRRRAGGEIRSERPVDNQVTASSMQMHLPHINGHTSHTPPTTPAKQTTTPKAPAKTTTGGGKKK